uniref:protein BEAN1 n=1 Tax=Odobenus rosmarus divergens TaxID=9708 RepID=UPI00063C7DD0|nr:PREDICTED: protein BEAN1 [Odobenus rosmarus divergens]
MSQPRPAGLEEAALETLLGDLIGYYKEEAGAGWLRVCREAALTHRAQQLLDTGAPTQFYLPELLVPGPGATHSWGAPSPAQSVCHELVQALEFLELISVNLLLFPWRKEIRSLKTYTGNFAYRVQPVLSEHTLHTLLGRLGYVATSEAEFSLVQAISKEDAKQMVFEIFLARVACEAILETSSRQVLGLDREKLARPHSRHSSGRRLVKAQNCPERAQPGPGPPEGLGSERALAEGPDHQSAVPVALSLPEVSTFPRTPLAGPLLQRHTSTRSDSEEFLTCYSDLVLHRTPLFPKDLLLSSLKGDQVQDPAQAPSPSSGEAVTSLASSGRATRVRASRAPAVSWDTAGLRDLGPLPRPLQAHGIRSTVPEQEDVPDLRAERHIPAGLLPLILPMEPKNWSRSHSACLPLGQDHQGSCHPRRVREPYAQAPRRRSDSSSGKAFVTKETEHQSEACAGFS